MCMRAHNVHACTRSACVRTACVRAHRCVRACVRAHGVHTCVHTECDTVRACTLRARVRAHGVHAHVALAHGVHACPRRALCVLTAVCLCAHGVGACIHPERSPWCTGRCLSASTTWRARVHTVCVRACVRACTRCACVHTACIRAHGVRACTRRSLVYPSSAVSIVCRSLLQRHHRRSLLRCCHCHCVQICWGLHRGPSRAPV
jgi:hypothetical protein